MRTVLLASAATFGLVFATAGLAQTRAPDAAAPVHATAPPASISPEPVTVPKHHRRHMTAPAPGTARPASPER